MRLRILSLFGLLGIVAACAFGQATGYVTVSGSNIADFGGNAVSNATITWTPVNNQGQVISAKIGATSGGQGITRPVSVPVSSGGFFVGLADTALTNPVNLCYQVTVTDNTTGNVLMSYPCVQPASTGQSWCSGSTCDFDNYIPSTPAGTVAGVGPTGPTGPAGAGSITGLSSDGASGISVTGKVTSPLGLFTSVASPATTAPLIIYDDDCSGDNDCLFTQTLLHHWIDVRAANVLGIIADSADTGSAPVMKIFETYFGHTSIPIGAWQGADVPGGSATSGWVPGMVSNFDAGDTRTNYSSCLTTYRTILAAAASSSIEIVSTGFATCLTQLLASPADGISSSTGAQLVKAKVSKMVLMGGDYPSGSESNFVHDPANFSSLFTTWTVPNGYPPIYLVGINYPYASAVGTPTTWATTNPAKYGQGLSTNTSSDVDQLALLYAIFGSSQASQWTVSASGTVSVNASTGADTWSSGTASGHFYLGASGTSATAGTIQAAMDNLPAILTGLYSATDLATGGISFVTGDEVSGPMGVFGGLEVYGFGTMDENIGGNIPLSATASYATACGALALASLTSGNGDTGCGQGALLSDTSGANNTAIGQNALFGLGATSGNTAVGVNAGGLGSTALVNSTFLGYNAIAAAPSDSNETVIGEGAIGNGSNTATIGNTSNTLIYLEGSAIATGGLFSGGISTTMSSSLSTYVLLPGTSAHSGLFVVGDYTAGGSAVFLLDPNNSPVLISSSITGVTAGSNVQWNQSCSGCALNWAMEVTSGAASRVMKWAFVTAR